MKHLSGAKAPSSGTQAWLIRFPEI
jgi:hypothetical protein